MRDRLRALWTGLLESLWFVPGLIGLGGVVLALVMIEVSTRVDSEALSSIPVLFGASADSSRSLLSTIAGSVITVAGVTFSLTMVAVTQASGQYTPRVLRTFMRDRPTQIVLGTFVGIFAYCLVVLRSVRSENESLFVPSIAVVLAIVLALVSTGALVFFVHHIANTLQASTLIRRVGRDTLHAVDEVFPAEVEDGDAAPDPSRFPTRRGVEWTPVISTRTGYVQGVDSRDLARTAERFGVVVQLMHEVGDFVVEGTPIVWVAPAEDVASRIAAEETRRDDGVGDRLVGCVRVGAVRTIDQDAAFGLRQLVDIALKALSPGINDTTTAVTCVNWTGAVLVRLANRTIGLPNSADDGVVRLVTRGPTFQGFLGLAVDEIRQHANGNVTVLARLIEVLGLAAQATRVSARRSAIAAKIGTVVEEVDRTVAAPADRDRLRILAQRVLRGGAPDVMLGAGIP